MVCQKVMVMLRWRLLKRQREFLQQEMYILEREIK